MDEPLRIVGIGGTVRPGSSTEQVLRGALACVTAKGADTVCFGGAELSRLPMYDPRTNDRSTMALTLLSELRKADGIILASPGYHGGISGLVKNALDYTEDLRQDPRPYFQGLPVGCIATGAGWQGVVTTLNQLRTVVHALRGWPTPLGIGINTFETQVDIHNFGDKLNGQLAVMQQELLVSASLHRETFAQSARR